MALALIASSCFSPDSRCGEAKSTPGRPDLKTFLGLVSATHRVVERTERRWSSHGEGFQILESASEEDAITARRREGDNSEPEVC
jgi:hypothetical protein